MADVRSHFLICTGGGCIASGALDVSEAVRAELKARELAGEIDVVETGCLGPCVQGPVALVYPDGVFYQNIKVDDVPEIVEEHLLKGRIVERLVSHAPGTDRTQAEMDDIPFFNRQVKIVLRNSGIIDPLNIDEYIARDGYQALAKVLTAMTPEAVVEEVLASGLRGRGGAGFPTGLKWRFAQQQDNDTKYILCNADEGDPGAFMDRSVLEGDPHCAHRGHGHRRLRHRRAPGLRLRARRVPAGRRASRARARAGARVRPARQEHHGQRLRLRPRDPHGLRRLRLRRGDRADDLDRGQPRRAAPAPAVPGRRRASGASPRVLNNVETFANIAADHPQGRGVVRQHRHREEQGHQGLRPRRQRPAHRPGRSPDRHAARRAHLRGRRRHPERQGVQGRPDRRSLGRLHPQGSTSTCPSTTTTLQELGAIMGSGGLIVMDEDTCMVDVARFFLEFIQEESCGKCPPCRVGTKRMLEIVDRICQGEGEEGDIERLIDLGEIIKRPPLCGLGQTAPNPVLTTIRHFRHEYEAHIKRQALRGRRLLDDVQGALLQRLPGQRQHPRLRQPRGREALRRGAQAAPRAQPARQHLRPRLLPPLREQVHARQPRRLARHPRRQALHGRAGEGRRSCRRSWRTPRTPRARSPSSAPGRPASPRLLPRPPGLQAGRVRGRAQGRRHARPGHPGLPPAARGARAAKSA